MGKVHFVQCPIKKCGLILPDVEVGQFSPYRMHYLGEHARIPRPIKIEGVTAEFKETEKTT